MTKHAKTDDAMRRHRITVRLDDAEMRNLEETARRLETTKSELVRSLASLPVETLSQAVEAYYGDRVAPVVAYDVMTYKSIAMQLRVWGYHYDRCLHALNTIASKKFLSVKDTAEYMDKALSYLEPIEEAANEIGRKLDDLMDADRIELKAGRLR